MLLFDHADLDASDLRDTLAFHRSDCRLVTRIVGPREIPDDLSIVGIGLEHNLGLAGPALEHVGAGPDRMRVGIVGVGLDHFASDGGHRGHRHNVREVVVRSGETDTQRIAVDDFEPGHLGVVVEAFRLRGLVGDGIQADDLAVDQEPPRRAVGRIDEALDRIRVVGRDQLAALALERRVGLEVDSASYLEEVGLAAVGDFGQRLGSLRHQLDRSGEVVVRQQALVDGPHHLAGIIVGDLGRIKAGLRNLEGDAQHFARIRGGDCRRSAQERTGEQHPRHGLLSPFRYDHPALSKNGA